MGPWALLRTSKRALNQRVRLTADASRRRSTTRFLAWALVVAGVTISGVANTGSAAVAAAKPKLGSPVPGFFEVPIPSSAVPDPKYSQIGEGALGSFRPDERAAYKIPAGVSANRLRAWYATTLPWRDNWTNWTWCARGSVRGGEFDLQTRTYSRGELLDEEVLQVHLTPTLSPGHQARIIIDHAAETSCSSFFKVD